MKVSAIVLAAGKGSRMHSAVHKQYIRVGDYPVVYYALKAFQNHPDVTEIILVVGADEVEYARETIVNRYHFDKVRMITPGGRERWESVKFGLQYVTGEYVMVHDGARPCITKDLLDRCIAEAQNYGACVAAMPVKDTIKQVDAEYFSVATPDRSTLWQIQTPQSFRTSLLTGAYEGLDRALAQGENVKLTDDAQLVEQFGDGTRIRMTEGSYRNIKVTTPEDLEIAAIFLAGQEESSFENS